jgi:hypothetical protein
MAIALADDLGFNFVIEEEGRQRYLERRGYPLQGLQ